VLCPVEERLNRDKALVMLAQPPSRWMRYGSPCIDPVVSSWPRAPPSLDGAVLTDSPSRLPIEPRHSVPPATRAGRHSEPSQLTERGVHGGMPEQGLIH
jgi:hypothetical protein